MKADCRAFAKWKEDKDAARKKAGLPPFKPRGVSSLEPGGGQPGDYGDYEEQLKGDAGVGMLDVDCDAVSFDDAGESEPDFDFDFGFKDDDEIIMVDEDELNRMMQAQAARAAKPVETSNMFSELDDSGDELDASVNMLEAATPQKSVTTPRSRPSSRGQSAMISSPTLASPWSAGSTESMADRMHREQQELLDKIAGVTSPSTRRPLLARWRSPEAQVPAARHGADGGSTAAATPPGFEKLEDRRSAEP